MAGCYTTKVNDDSFYYKFLIHGGWFPATVQTVFGNQVRCVLWVKEEYNPPDCFERKAQKPESVRLQGCVGVHVMGNLHICVGTFNAESYTQVQKKILCCHPGVFFRDFAAYSSRTTQSHVLCTLKQCGSPDPSPIEKICRIMKRKYGGEDDGLLCNLSYIQINTLLLFVQCFQEVM